MQSIPRDTESTSGKSSRCSSYGSAEQYRDEIKHDLIAPGRFMNGFLRQAQFRAILLCKTAPGWDWPIATVAVRPVAAPSALQVQCRSRSVMHRFQLYAGLRRRQAAGRMNAGVVGVKGEDALHITFDSRRGEIEGKQSCHTVAADAMTMAHIPNRLRLFVTGLPSTAANLIPGIKTVRRTAGDEVAVRSLSKDSSSLAPLSMTKLWIAS